MEEGGQVWEKRKIWVQETKIAVKSCSGCIKLSKIQPLNPLILLSFLIKVVKLYYFYKK